MSAGFIPSGAISSSGAAQPLTQATAAALANAQTKQPWFAADLLPPTAKPWLRELRGEYRYSVALGTWFFTPLDHEWGQFRVATGMAIILTGLRWFISTAPRDLTGSAIGPEEIFSGVGSGGRVQLRADGNDVIDNAYIANPLAAGVLPRNWGGFGTSLQNTNEVLPQFNIILKQNQLVYAKLVLEGAANPLSDPRLSILTAGTPIYFFHVLLSGILLPLADLQKMRPGIGS